MQYIFGVHPHAIHATGMLPLLRTNSEFYDRFPSLRGKLIGVVRSQLAKGGGKQNFIIWRLGAGIEMTMGQNIAMCATVAKKTGAKL